MKNGENYNKKYTNEITIIYDINKSREFAIEDEFYDERTKELGDTISKEKLFGEIFVNNNKNICKIIINNEKKDLCSYLDNYKNYINENKLEIKLIGVENIIDASYMFSGCVSLASLPDISKWNTIKVNSLKEIFFLDVQIYHHCLIFQNGILKMLRIFIAFFKSVLRSKFYLIYLNGILKKYYIWISFFLVVQI